MTITPQLLLNAYASGFFPMSEGRDDPELFWVDPKRRGIFPLEQFRISRSLARRMRRQEFRLTLNEDFTGVVKGCANRVETWINHEIFDLYHQLHEMGFAHSIEVWDKDGDLVGGIYGVTLGRAFFGESMFSYRTDASKIALAYLCDHLRRTEFALFDTQFITPHLASLGAIEIPRARYRGLLADALSGVADFHSVPLEASPAAVLQRSTHTS